MTKKARKIGLTVVPALNKIDVPGVDVDDALEQLTFECELDPEQTMLVSARKSKGVAELVGFLFCFVFFFLQT